MKIYKYEIPLKDKFDLELPAHSRILSFQVQNGRPYIWVLLDQNKPELTIHHFILVGTGNEFSPNIDNYSYIGTVPMDYFVWHLFKEF